MKSGRVAWSEVGCWIELWFFKVLVSWCCYYLLMVVFLTELCPLIHIENLVSEWFALVQHWTASWMILIKWI